MNKFTSRNSELSTLHSPLFSRRGFTLIELLVVIAIIGILSTFLTVNFIGARQRGRDATRKSDLRQIQIPLESIRSDLGKYPTTAEWTAAASCGNAFTYSSVEYIKKLACDPSSGTRYTYTSGGTSYTLYACLENIKDSQRDADDGDTTAPGIDSCATTGEVSYTVQNP